MQFVQVSKLGITTSGRNISKMLPQFYLQNGLFHSLFLFASWYHQISLFSFVHGIHIWYEIHLTYIFQQSVCVCVCVWACTCVCVLVCVCACVCLCVCYAWANKTKVSNNNSQCYSTHWYPLQLAHLQLNLLGALFILDLQRLEGCFPLFCRFVVVLQSLPELLPQIVHLHLQLNTQRVLLFQILSNKHTWFDWSVVVLW